MQLYAIWQRSTFTIYMHTNGGYFNSYSISNTYGERVRNNGAVIGELPSVNGSLSTLAERTGYIFAGWWTTSGTSGGTQVTATTVVTSDITIYARWIPVVSESSIGSYASISKTGGDAWSVHQDTRVDYYYASDPSTKPGENFTYSFGNVKTWYNLTVSFDTLENIENEFESFIANNIKTKFVYIGGTTMNVYIDGALVYSQYINGYNQSISIDLGGRTGSTVQVSFSTPTCYFYTSQKAASGGYYNGGTYENPMNISFAFN